VFVGLLGIIASRSFGNIYNGQLLHAAEVGDDQGVRDLVSTDRCDINAVNETGFSPLMLACRAGQVQIVEELLKKKASVHIANELGQTALLLVIEHDKQGDLGRIEIVKKLIREGACVDVRDNEGNTPYTPVDIQDHEVTESAWGDPSEAEYINNSQFLKKRLYKWYFFSKSSGIFSGGISTDTNTNVRTVVSYSRLNVPMPTVRLLHLLRFIRK